MKPQDTYQLRWRGRQIGPFTVQTIEQQLDDQELGMSHEIFYDNQWITLSSFFVEVSRRAKATEMEIKAHTNTLPPSRSGFHPKDSNASTRQPTGIRLVPNRISKTVLASGKEVILLDNITFVIEPNEFVALLGPSGSGKSTLMDAINGRRPATSGSVQINEDDLYTQFDKLRDNIGYVPQKDIVHLPLTVRQELTFAARLRLPAETPRETIDQIVSEVMGKTGLKERQHTRNANLSGGQLKRVSVGVELLADPKLLFLDEPTSGLDPGTDARMMTLFGKLANEGKTIICVTHNMENLGLCDLVVMVACGKLVYYGPPGDLLIYFGVGELKSIFSEALGDGSDDPVYKKQLAEKWADRYRSSEYYQRYVVQRLQQKVTSVATNHFTSGSARPNGLADGWRQFLILTQRYATVTFQDRKNMLLLLAQAPVIAGSLALAFPQKTLQLDQQTLIAFFLTVSAIWFGCTNSAREIVKELPIYDRERAINLCLPSYIGSKMSILSSFCLLQCLILFYLTSTLTSFHPVASQVVPLLVITALSAMMLGLLVSAIVDTTDKAMTIVPMLLIPQLLFAGAVMPLSGLAKQIAYYLIISYWSYDGMIHTLGQNQFLKPQYDLPTDIISLCLFFTVFVAATVLVLKMNLRIKNKSN